MYKAPDYEHRKADFQLLNREGYHKYLNLLYRLEAVEDELGKLQESFQDKIWALEASQHLDKIEAMDSSPTTEPPTKENPSVVPEDLTRVLTLQSPHLLIMSQQGLDLGHVGRCYSCRDLLESLLSQSKTPAQDAHGINLTSVKKASEEYVEPVSEDAPLPLEPNNSNCICEKIGFNLIMYSPYCPVYQHREQTLVGRRYNEKF